jgi:uncharacterized protein DUF4136
MKDARLGFALAIALAAAATGLNAAKVKVRSDYDKKFDFAALHTYSWHPDGAGDVKLLQATNDNPSALRGQLEPVIKSAVDQILRQRGFTNPTTGKPDFYVYYYVLVGPNISAQTMGQFLAPVPEWGVPPFAPSTTSLEIYEQGTLIVDVSSVSLQSMVWRGTAQAEIDRARSDAARDARIRDAVGEMFKKFPPKK